MVDYAALATEVVEHATANYNAGGWDYVVETMTKQEIAAELEQQAVKNSKQAIEYYAELVALWDEHRDEINNA